MRLVLFALTPTIYGVENTLLYIPNDTFGPGFDGWPTFIAPIVSLLAFVAVAVVTSGRPEAPLPSRSTPVAATEA